MASNNSDLTPQEVSGGGYNYDFADPGIAEQFHCSICTMVARDPKLVVKCGHTFCGFCIDKWTEQTRRCPIDNVDIPVGGIVLHHERKRTILGLRVRCEHREEGCEATPFLADTQTHLTRCLIVINQRLTSQINDLHKEIACKQEMCENREVNSKNQEQLEIEIACLCTAMDESKSELEALNNHVSEQMRKIEELENDKQVSAFEMTILSVQNSEQKSYIENLEHHICGYNETCEKFLGSDEQLKKENMQLMETLARRDEEIVLVKIENDNLLINVMMLERSKDKVANDNGTLLENIAGLEDRVKTLEGLEPRCIDLTDSLRALGENIERLRKENEHLLSNVETLEESKVKVVNDNEHLLENIAELKGKVKSLEGFESQTIKLMDDIERLRKENEHLLSNVGTLEESKVKVVNDNEQLLENIAGLERRVKTLEGFESQNITLMDDIHAQSKVIESLRNENGELCENMVTLEQLKDVVTSDNAKLLETISGLQDRVKTLEGVESRNVELRGSLHVQGNAIESLREENDSLLKKVGTLQGSNDKVASDNVKLVDTIADLEDKKTFEGLETHNIKLVDDAHAQIRVIEGMRNENKDLLEYTDSDFEECEPLNNEHMDSRMKNKDLLGNSGTWEESKDNITSDNGKFPENVVDLENRITALEESEPLNNEFVDSPHAHGEVTERLWNDNDDLLMDMVVTAVKRDASAAETDSSDNNDISRWCENPAMNRAQLLLQYNRMDELSIFVPPQ